MVEQAARTFICSVVFVDLVEFSRKSNAEQVLVKETCNALAAEALEPISPDDRIVIDTGDGFAITFLGDPEDALLVGLKLRDGIEDAMSNHSIGIGRGTANGHVRIGINLGPVKLGTNFNGHVNIVGDGINVAERIMGFALPGQMLVSRSFHDMVSRLAEEYGALLTFDGTRTDNNARVHALYVAGKGDAALKVAEARAVKRRASATTTTRVISPPAAEAATTAPAAVRPFTADSPPPHLAPLAAGNRTAANGAGSWLHDRRKVGSVAVLLLLAAGIQSALLVQKWRASSPPAAVATTTPTLATPPAMTEAPAKTEAPSTNPALPVPAPVASNPAAAPATPSVSPAAPPKAPPKSGPVPAPAPEPAAKMLESPAKSAARAASPTISPATVPPVAPVPTKTAPRAASPASGPTTTSVTPVPSKNPPPQLNRPVNPERKAETARDERPPAKRQAAPQGLQLPAPTIAAPAATGSKAPAASTPPVDATALPAAPPPRPAAPAPAAIVKRSGAIPEFPREAAREGLTRGSVIAKVFIDSAGNVKDIQIVESRPSRVFDRAVRRALMEWKFNPGADNRVYEADIDFKRDN